MTALKTHLTVFLVMFCFVTHQAIAEEKPPVAVEVRQIQYQPYARPIYTSGILAHKRRQTLSFKTSGPVEQLMVEVGDRVKKGELLAHLNLYGINAQEAEASARKLQAQRNLKRYQQLHTTNALSLDQLQQAETDLRVADSQLQVAAFNQKYSSIHAPANGLILKRHVEKHELVAPNQPILELADESQGWVIKTGVTDREIARIRLNDRAEISFDALPSQMFKGQVTQLGVVGNDKTGTFEIEISMPANDQDHPAPGLRAGYVSQIKIIPSITRSVALIPAMSIITANKNASVFIYNPETKRAETQDVVVEFIDGGKVAISSGLTEDDLLITSGAGLLRNNEKARVISK